MKKNMFFILANFWEKLIMEKYKKKYTKTENQFLPSDPLITQMEVT